MEEVASMWDSERRIDSKVGAEELNKDYEDYEALLNR